ncbi:uncharacterized protein LOC108669674 isoform X2 [Hyalella azteca]|uniref:Uncharacterized protein LOC108669674 isoform X2 n=1 Tax=Hyalella azteca TaxID=294128 RepID=A0A8B7NG20_HYAAZ|nr:uncharacterized protein LOC108669674 isoform X2 [Hyalella azteca]
MNMVHHFDHETYSFHLDHFDSPNSSKNSTLSSIHKQRIDLLFQSQRQIQRGRYTSQDNSSRASTRRTSVSPAPRSRSNSILRPGRPAHLRHSSSVTVNTQNDGKNEEETFIRKTREQTISSKVAVNQEPTTVIRIGPDSRPLPPKPNRDLSASRAQVSVTNTSSNDVQVKPQQTKKNAQEELERAFGGKDQQQKAFLNTRSAVQAQIEKLFADASKENTAKNNLRDEIPLAPQLTPHTSRPTPDAPPPPPPLETHPAFRNTPSPKSPSSTIKRNTPSPHSSGTVSACSTISRTSSSHSSSQGSTTTNSNMVYRVNYLGAVQLTGKATSLEVLQDPLKQLYYIHKFGVAQGRRVPLSTLSITDSGLRVLRNATEKDSVDFTNPFSTIAVWAAIKMVIKKKIGNNGLVNYCYAFLPLICDPEAQEKFNTYYPLDVADPTVMEGSHPPMFACVMRKTGESKVLECHGFICRSSEDAIVIAANLYQALLGTMNNDSSSPTTEPGDVMSDNELTPTRPPRRRRTPPHSNQGSLRRAISEDILRSNTSQDSITGRLQRKTSNLNGLAIAEETEVIPNNKLVIPRSKSFVNVSQALDAHNLFGDPKTKMGLGRIDDVLRAVINPNGMSYSEMDPQHRELLMKMALILTKDEIYQRSKNIMRSQKPRSHILGGFESDSDASTITSVIKATKRSISRFSSRASHSLRPSYLKERMPLKKFNTHQGPISLSKDLDEPKLKAVNYGYMSDGSLPRRTPKTPMPRRSPTGRGYAIYSECEYDSECSSKCYCTLPLKKGKSHVCLAGDNKFSSLHSKKKQGCDCDSESCAESERCYCSLKKIKKNGLKMYEINLDSETDTTVTNGTLKREISRSTNKLSSSHSTDEVRSNTLKSPQRRNSNASHLSQPLERSKSRLQTNSTLQRNQLMRPRSMSTSSPIHPDSLSILSRSSSQLRPASRPRSRALSSDNILEETKSNRRYRHQSGSLGSTNSESSSRSSPGLDSHNSDGSSADSNSSQTKILLLSAVDPSGKVVYRNASQRKRRPTDDTASIMSMKKTAEIAALFSELKLSQKTDLIERLQEQIYQYG